MKKLFVLFLCLMAVAGFAGTVHPPGAVALEMVLPGYGVDYCAVTPDTVLVAETPAYGLPDLILVVSDIMSGLPHVTFRITVSDTDQTLPDVPAEFIDYPLRL
jgi:hypothetical protein